LSFNIDRTLLPSAYKSIHFFHVHNELIELVRVFGIGVGYSKSSFENVVDISNNSSFGLKHPGVPDGSDGSDGTSYPLTENQTRPVAQAPGGVAYLPCGSY